MVVSMSKVRTSDIRSELRPVAQLLKLTYTASNEAAFAKYDRQCIRKYRGKWKSINTIAEEKAIVRDDGSILRILVVRSEDKESEQATGLLWLHDGGFAYGVPEQESILVDLLCGDGSCIAFAYQGDIFLVPSQGGLARQLTSNPAHDTEPLWSADGKWIVFASVREGSKDLWAISAEGGAPRRLTCYGGSETPLAMTPDGNVLFSANIEDVPGSSVFTHSSTTPIPEPAIIPTQFFHPLLLQYPHTAKPTMKYSSMWMLDRKLLYST